MCPFFLFRTIREASRVLRDSIADGVEQYQQRHRQQSGNAYNPSYGPNMSSYVGYSPIEPPDAGPASWGLLILSDKTTPSTLFVYLLDAIFNLALPSDTSNTADVLTPTRLTAVYEELGYLQEDNLPFLLFRHAHQSGESNDPHARVNEGMRMAWRIFELEHTTVATARGAVPGLTRQGFRTMMVRDGLIYPPGQANAYSNFLDRHRGKLLAQGVAIPPAEMDAESLMPPGVPLAGDVDTQRLYKQRQGAWVAEYRSCFGGQDYHQEAGMAAGVEPGGWALAMQLQTFKHNMTMDALTQGYSAPNGRGSYDYHYTGGLSW
ncbi:hypothetical protein B0H67DRAFT_563234 [Lasiosphaeris hirsuta]|uniref:DUF7514 domain-containing protein n=1 Tax=Lasiosphaeris hirsuta TaxID=260670 RepID=A0AA40BBB7_9PEZI|nr:hypothetical protein B0H67DRAFT_563234 [Lasiosphaeris hirsuta]